MKKLFFLLFTLGLFHFGMTQTVKSSLTAKKINDELFLNFNKTEFRNRIVAQNTTLCTINQR